MKESNLRPDLFSLLSGVFSLITIGLIIFTYNIFPDEIVPLSEEVAEFDYTLISRILAGSLVIGAIVSIISFARKEPSSWYKWVSSILNLLMLFVFGGVFLLFFMMG